jgi:hypothetical protein
MYFIATGTNVCVLLEFIGVLNQIKHITHLNIRFKQTLQFTGIRLLFPWQEMTISTELLPTCIISCLPRSRNTQSTLLIRKPLRCLFLHQLQTEHDSVNTSKQFAHCLKFSLLNKISTRKICAKFLVHQVLVEDRHICKIRKTHCWIVVRFRTLLQSTDTAEHYVRWNAPSWQLTTS